MLLQKLVILAAVSFKSCAARPTLIPAKDTNIAEDVAFFNNTLVDRDDTHPPNPIEKGMLDELQNSYPGIYWYTAYPGGEAPQGTPRDGGCLVRSYHSSDRTTSS